MTWTRLYWLDALALLIFLVSYYRDCYRKNFKIDFWHLQLFLLCVLPNVIMLPFARSELNGIVLGRDLPAVIEVLPQVYLITVVGFFSMLAGGAVWSLGLGVGLRKQAERILNVVPRCSLMMLSSRPLLLFHTLVCLGMQAGILLIYYTQSGFGFDVRAFTFANPALRPVALVASNYSIITASHCLARYVDRKEKILLACTLLLSLGLVFFGARSNLVAIYLSIFVCFLIQRRDKISLLRVVGTGSVMICAVFYMGFVRNGFYSLSTFFGALVFLLFYGNNFSDLRDFAWVYSGWNHSLWMGKTYLAALMAFVPRVASEFRDTWGAGVAMDTQVGLDPQVHPGLRPGSFGEAYFNFGLIGVIIAGLALGIVARRVDLDTRSALTAQPPSTMRAFASTMLLGMANIFAISVSSSGIYVLLGIYAFSWVLLQGMRMVTLAPPPRDGRNGAPAPVGK